MNVLRSIVLWITGFVALGVILFAGIVLSYWVRPETLDRWLKKACRVFLRIMGVRLEIEGAESVPAGRPVLFMANHVSLFDVPVLEAAIPVFARAVEADRQFKWPVYGWAVRRFGNIPIRREDVHSSIRSIRKGEDWLASGKSLVILPEGHRTPDGRTGPFKKLPFHLARQAGVDIVPIGMSGLYRLKARHSWIIRPGAVKVKFGAPVPADTVRQLSVEALRDRVREAVLSLVEAA
jgi:1-acyl-sn-glycerol-3-phosphate acyltransferase